MPYAPLHTPPLRGRALLFALTLGSALALGTSLALGSPLDPVDPGTLAPASSGARAALPDFGLSGSDFDKRVSLEIVPGGLPLEAVLRALIRNLGYTAFVKDLPAVNVTSGFKDLPFSQVVPLLLSLGAPETRLSLLPNKVILIEGRVKPSVIPPEPTETLTLPLEARGPNYLELLPSLGAKAVRSGDSVVVQVARSSAPQLRALIDTLRAGVRPRDTRVFTLENEESAAALAGVLLKLYPDASFVNFGASIIGQGPPDALEDVARLSAALKQKASASSPTPTPPNLITRFYRTQGSPEQYAKSLITFYPRLRVSVQGGQLIAQFDAALAGEIDAFVARLDASIPAQEGSAPSTKPTKTLTLPVKSFVLTGALAAQAQELALTLNRMFEVRAEGAAGVLLVQASPGVLEQVSALLDALPREALPPPGVARTYPIVGPPAEVARAAALTFRGKFEVLPTLGVFVAVADEGEFAALERTLALVNVASAAGESPPAADLSDSLAAAPLTQVLGLQGSALGLEAAIEKSFTQVKVSRVGRALVLSGPEREVLQAAGLVSALDIPDAPSPTKVDAATSEPPRTQVVTLEGEGGENLRAVLEASVPGLKAQLAGRNLVLSGGERVLKQGAELVAALDRRAPEAPSVLTSVVALKGSNPGLEAVLTSSVPGLKTQRLGQRLVISAPAAELERAAALIKQLDTPDPDPPAPSPTGTRSYPLRYASAEVISAQLKTLAPLLSWTADSRSNTLIGQGTPQALEAALGIIASLDAAIPQAELRVRVLQIDVSGASQLGVDWAKLASGLSFSNLRALAGGDLSALNASLNLLAQNGKSRTLTDSAYLVQSKSTARLVSGGTVLIGQSSTAAGSSASALNYQNYTYGLDIALTPTVSLDGAITLELNASLGRPPIAGVGGSLQFPAQSFKSLVHFTSGQTVIFGGLVGSSTVESKSGIPILSDLPLIGGLFSTTTKSSANQALLIQIEGRAIGEAPEANLGFALSAPELALPTPASATPARPTAPARPAPATPAQPSEPNPPVSP